MCLFHLYLEETKPEGREEGGNDADVINDQLGVNKWGVHLVMFVIFYFCSAGLLMPASCSHLKVDEALLYYGNNCNNSRLIIKVFFD